MAKDVEVKISMISQSQMVKDDLNTLLQGMHQSARIEMHSFSWKLAASRISHMHVMTRCQIIFLASAKIQKGVPKVRHHSTATTTNIS